MRLFFSVLLILFTTSFYAQKTCRKPIAIPDINGYHTLKCDMHTHTVFSDGEVWPTTRVTEAWLDGLDAIAITDHLEYTPHKQVAKDRNAAYDIAKGKANELNVILIKGGEITRWHPLGHVNCWFTSDNELIYQKDSVEAVREAKRQNAIIQWNHPGSYRKNNIPVWTETQDFLYNSGLLNAIEIVNRNEYFPLAHKWAIEKKLAITGGSDIHRPVHMDYGEKMHRPMTLVFAKEKSDQGIKEAILDRRTAVYYGDTLIGSEEFLKPIFENSIRIHTPTIKIHGKQWIGLQIENTSDIPLIIDFKSRGDEFASLGNGIKIQAHSSESITIKGLKETVSGIRKYSIQCEVVNFWTSPDTKLNANIDFNVDFTRQD